MNFSKYDPATGRILFVGDVPESMIELQGENVCVGFADPGLHMIKDETVTIRPIMNVELSATTVQADGVTEVTLTGVPAGATVRINGPVNNSGEADDGPIILTFAIQGEYHIDVDLFPYQESKVTIHAI